MSLPTIELRPEIWSWRDLLLFLVYAPLALLFSNFFVLGAFAALRSAMGWQTSSSTLQSNPFFLLTLQSVFYAMLFGYVYLLVVTRYRQPFWLAMKWRRPTAHQVLRLVLVGAALALAVRLAPAVFPEKETFPLQELFNTRAAMVALAGFAILVAPLMEELLFRGVLFAFFEHQVGLRFAVVGTALLFAGLHIPEYWGAWNHIFLLTLVGFAFSLARGLTGSVVPSVILHLAYNTSIVLGMFVEAERFQTVRAFIDLRL